MTKREREKLERIAYHEAGHVVVAVLRRRRFRFVTIEPHEDKIYGGSLGRVEETHPLDIGSLPDYETRKHMRVKLRGEIMFCLAGEPAVNIFTERQRRTGVVDDWGAEIIAAVLCRTPEEKWQYLNRLTRRVEVMLRQNWPAVRAVAEALLEHRTLNYLKVRQIIRNAVNACGLGCAAEKGPSLPPARKSPHGKPKGGLQDGLGLQER